MIVFRNRTKEIDTREASWETLYLLTENWKKDMEFYLFEIKFLETLIENNFSELLLFQNLDELRELQIEVFEIKNQCEYKLKCIQINLDSIVDIIEGTYEQNTAEFRNKNRLLEDHILEFINIEKEFRRVVFSIIKDLLKNKKAKQVWMFN